MKGKIIDLQLQNSLFRMKKSKKTQKYKNQNDVEEKDLELMANMAYANMKHKMHDSTTIDELKDGFRSKYSLSRN